MTRTLQLEVLIVVTNTKDMLMIYIDFVKYGKNMYYVNIEIVPYPIPRN